MPQLFLIAQIAGRAVAIESGQVESVVDIGAVVPVPCADHQVRGLAALRGTVCGGLPGGKPKSAC